MAVDTNVPIFPFGTLQTLAVIPLGVNPGGKTIGKPWNSRKNSERGSSRKGSGFRLSLSELSNRLLSVVSFSAIPSAAASFGRPPRFFVCEDYQNGYNPGMSTKKLQPDEKQLVANFGDNLAALMEKRDLSVQNLADAVEISFMTVYRILRKERLPQLLIASRLADYFGTSVDSLIAKPKKN